MKPCAFDGCQNSSAYKNGLCGSHRRQLASRGVLRPIRIPGTANKLELDLDGESAWLILVDITGNVRARTRIDVVDAPVVSAHRWYVSLARIGMYACRATDDLSLHRFLCSAPPDTEVDHINGDGLDNRRQNLRITSRMENAQNFARRGREDMRNVSFDSTRGKWLVIVHPNGRHVYGGRFTDLADAKRRAAELRAIHFPFANEARHA